MDDADIAGAYEPFVEELRRGGFAEPPEGWPASARRLAAAWSSLDDETGAHLVPAHIVDGGRVVRDDPVPIRRFIEGNASFHLDMHLSQLRALRP